MPTPQVYSRLAKFADGLTAWLLLGSLGLLAAAVVSAIAFSGANPGIILAVCMPVVIWCWGLLMAASWFREGGVLSGIANSHIRTVVHWVASLFLTIWLLSPIAIPFVFM